MERAGEITRKSDLTNKCLDFFKYVPYNSLHSKDMQFERDQYIGGTDIPPRFTSDTLQAKDSLRIEALFDTTLSKNEIIAQTPQPVLSFVTHEMRRYWEHAPTDAIRQMIKRKIIHTRRVMAVAAQIAMATSEVEFNFAEVLSTAALHDVARFPQVFHYQTFRDADSFDHAQLGAERIEQSQLPFDDCGINGASVIEAVALHSVHSLPSGASDLARIIRDADKLVILTEDVDDFDKDTRTRQRAAMNGDAFEQFRNVQVVMNGNAPRLPVDKLLQRLSWIYDLNFAATRGLIAERNIFPKLLNHFAEYADVGNGVEVDLAQIDKVNYVTGKILEWQGNLVYND